MKSTFVLPITVLALAATAACWAQTRPAAKTPEITVSVWTCPRHDELRLGDKGQCPICQKTLERTRVAIKGGDVAGDPYPLETCPVSGLILGDKGPPIAMMHESREVRFCCAGCIKPFLANPQKYLEKINEALVKQQLERYPLTTCPVSKEPLDAMGGAVNYVHNNRLVRFCCNGCLRQFKKDPVTFMTDLDAAVIAKQKEHYPLTTCPISGEALTSMGGPVDLVVANRLVRFCCNGCVGAFYKAPAVHLAALDKAWEKQGPVEGHGHDQDPGDTHDDDHDHGHDHDHDHDH